MTANWLTVVLVIYLGLGALSGWRRGFILVVFSLAGYLVGLNLASRFQSRATAILAHALPISAWVKQIVPTAASSVPGAYTQGNHLALVLLGLLVFLIIVGAAEMVARLFGESLTGILGKVSLLRGLNTFGGLLGGMAEHAVIIGLVLGILLSVPFVAHTPLALLIRGTPIAIDLVHWVGGLAHWPAAKWLAAY